MNFFDPFVELWNALVNSTASLPPSVLSTLLDRAGFLIGIAGIIVVLRRPAAMSLKLFAFPAACWGVADISQFLYPLFPGKVLLVVYTVMAVLGALVSLYVLYRAIVGPGRGAK